MRGRYVQRMPILSLIFVLLFVACGGSDSTGGVDVDAGPTPTTSLASPEPGLAEGVDGEWRLVGTGTDEGIDDAIAWEIAEKTDGESICYYAEFDPPPADDYYVNPYAPYSPDPEHMDVLSENGLTEDAEEILDKFAGCAPVPTELGVDGRALQQIGAADPVAFFLENMSGLAYHYLHGVVADDATLVSLTFDDGTTRDITPVDDHFVDVFPPEGSLTEVDVSNEEVTVACAVVGQEVDVAGCGGPVLREGTSARRAVTEDQRS